MRLYIFMCALCASLSAYTQIAINTDLIDQSAALDITSTDRGLLIPRMTNAQKIAITAPKEGLLVYDSNKKCISIYTYLVSTGALGWTCLTSINSAYFYMPSINIDTSTLANGKKLDLYAEYRTQFSTPLNVSSGASPTILDVFAPNDMYYYVTYYDKDKIKINSISNIGVMDYDVVGHANYDTYMNVIFVIK